MGYSIKARVLAVRSWYMAGSIMATAMAIFKDPTEQVDVADACNVSDVDGFIRRTVDRFEATGSVDSPRRLGPPRKIPDAELHLACEEFKHGWEDQWGRKHYYRSIDEAISGPFSNDYLVWLVDQFDVKDIRKTLWRRMLTADSDIRHILRSVKHNFTNVEKTKRMEAAAQHLASSKAHAMWLASIVWIDAKSGWTTPEGEWVYASAKDAADPGFPVPHNASTKLKLKFYIAVNALIGPVAIIFVSGTSGQAQVYKV